MRDKKIRQIVCGEDHTFILKNNGELFAFGRNNYGQLGLGNNENVNVPTLLKDKIKDKKIQQIICGEQHIYILTKSGKLFAFGNNYYGQLGLGDYIDRNVPTLMNKEIQQIVCGRNHTFILKNNDELFTFGYNYFGQLGLGDHGNRKTPTLLTKEKGIRQIICGADHTFILKNNGKLFAFGFNIQGQLGLDDYKNKDEWSLLMTNENIKIINNTIIKKIEWRPDIFSTLSVIKQKEIFIFLLVCHYYKYRHQINMVKYMKNMITNLLF